MAFGDGHNDIEMLDIVGYPIVMGNGSEEVKKTWQIYLSKCK